MKNINYDEMMLSPLTKTQSSAINGGNIWQAFWRRVGYIVGKATIPNMDNYDLEGEYEAAQTLYGAPY